MAKKVKKEEKYSFTLEEWGQALQRADVLIKQSNGHEYMRILKTRCQNCGRSPNQKGICRNWQISFVNKVLFVLMNKDTELISDDNKKIVCIGKSHDNFILFLKRINESEQSKYVFANTVDKVRGLEISKIILMTDAPANGLSFEIEKVAKSRIR